MSSLILVGGRLQSRKSLDLDFVNNEYVYEGLKHPSLRSLPGLTYTRTDPSSAANPTYGRRGARGSYTEVGGESPISGNRPIGYAAGTAERFLPNVPRRTSAGFLAERAATNMLAASGDLTNTSFWVHQNVSILANQGYGPDGQLNLEKVLATTTNGPHSFSQFRSITPGSHVCASIFLKGWEVPLARIARVIVYDGGNYFYGPVVDLYNGTVLSVASSGSPVGTGYSVENWGNGLFRIGAQAYFSGSTAGIYVNTYGGTTASPQQSYAGDGGSGMLAGWAQLEAVVAEDAARGWPSSYIETSPTVGQFRARDKLSLVCDSPKGAFVEWEMAHVNRYGCMASFSKNGASQATGVYLHCDGAGSGYVIGYNAGVNAGQFQFGPVQAGINRLAVSYDGGVVRGSLNGQAVGGINIGTIATDRLYVGGTDDLTPLWHINECIRRVQVFNQPISDLELRQMAAL